MGHDGRPACATGASEGALLNDVGPVPEARRPVARIQVVSVQPGDEFDER